MPIMALTDCCRLLSIDAKTLRRWLAQAQLPLQRHVDDGRKKGLSEEHLRRLARLHHRALLGLPQDEPARPLADEPAVLPADLLALSERLAALQAQLLAVQQQLSALTQLLLLHAPQPPVPAAGQAKRPPKAAPAVPRSPRAAAATAKSPPKPTHVIALVEASSAGGYVVICPKQGLLAFEPDSPAWFAWLARQSSFRFVGRHGRFTAHHEVQRVPNGAWRAHRHLRNHSYNLRLGLTADLTIAVLEQTAATLQAHLT